MGGGEADLEAMTIAELVEYAAGLGIELSMTMTKAEMIEAIEGAE